MGKEESQKKFLLLISNLYRFAALILLNTLIFLIILNFFLFIIFKIDDKAKQNIIFEKYSSLNIGLLYPDMNKYEIDQLLKETWSRTYLYEPFTQFKEAPYKGTYVNIDKNGFRHVKNQGPWPPQFCSLNIFVFGGSTTFGYGVSDNQTIASYLQGYLTEKLEKDVHIYNFGRGYYYLTQERLLYEQLLQSGFIPDLAIFIDGLNDIGFNENEPYFTNRLRNLFATDTLKMLFRFISMTPLGRAAEIVRDNIILFFSKEEQIKGSIVFARIKNRYLFDKKSIEASSNLFGVQPIFIWQPNPYYNNEKSYYPFPAKENEKDNPLKYNYIRMANFVKDNSMGSNFLWCADIQNELTQPLYVDQVHYSASFSKIIAEFIANQLVVNFNFRKRSDNLATGHKLK